MSALQDASVFGAPQVDPSVYIGHGTTLVGDVSIGRQSSVWYNCVLRGDVQKIVVGMRTNIQDGTVIHGTTNGLPVIIGDDVTVGHGAILHACTIENMGFVGFGARVLDGAVVRSGGMLAAGAVLTPRKVVGAGELWAGNPARLLRTLSDEEFEGMAASAVRYATLAERYKTARPVILTF
ncbi:gamma carbonic anhydrase family protein [Paraburkholderia phytofirmans]|uniref:Gamma carbonic anhydrase family protein n=1 Tax=Paraburkholderia phytofirmans OLGA172 TaxID=1417228 RepID=A0A160FT23_9BURK|nr:gamma carbonic anhydrase family protein [Paraburkholderia phytofirmans]ANB76295.1 gamma carbonic anhydrase family protein [Paraburkholderia phytofirmans OLGA172]